MELTNRNAIPFYYVVNVTIAAGSSAATTLIMMADSYFELAGIFGSTSNTNEATQVSPNNFSVQIRDQTSGNDLMSNQVQQRVLCGNAFNGLYEKRPIVFEPQSNLLFDFRNLDALNPVTVQLVLKGTKIKL